MITTINEWKKINESKKITLQQDSADKIKITLDEDVILKQAKKMFKHVKTIKDVYLLGTSNYNKLIKELSKINESNLPNEMVKALDDIDETRPNRMKRPGQSNNDWSGRGGERGMVYIQDEAEEVMQDKYGRERGHKLWMGSINAPQRGAMFKMADDVMKEKSWLYDQLNITPRTYWDVSYYSLWKAWMDKQGLSYRVDTPEERQAKIDAKLAKEEEAKQQAQAAQQAQKQRELDNAVQQLNNEINTLPNVNPDAKDKQRIVDMFRRNSWPSNAAHNMANAIKDVNKAVRRGKAAMQYVIDNNLSQFKLDVAKIFFNRAKQLQRSNESVVNEKSAKNLVLRAMNVLTENGINDFPGGEYNSNPPYITFDSSTQAIEALEILMNKGFNVQIDQEYDHVINFLHPTYEGKKSIMDIDRYNPMPNGRMEIFRFGDWVLYDDMIAIKEDFDPSMPFEDEPLYHNIDWVKLGRETEDWFYNNYSYDDCTANAFQAIFEKIKEEILKYKMLD